MRKVLQQTATIYMIGDSPNTGAVAYHKADCCGADGSMPLYGEPREFKDLLGTKVPITCGNEKCWTRRRK